MSLYLFQSYRPTIAASERRAAARMAMIVDVKGDLCDVGQGHKIGLEDRVRKNNNVTSFPISF